MKQTAVTLVQPPQAELGPVPYEFIPGLCIEWPSGPWDNEMDIWRLTWESSGLPCAIFRHVFFGHLCGYVGFPKNPSELSPGTIDAAQLRFDVHGGCTYTKYNPDNELFWFGFDCNHYYDRAPAIGILFAGLCPDAKYRNIAYVTAETNSLAAQIRKWLNEQASA